MKYEKGVTISYLASVLFYAVFIGYLQSVGSAWAKDGLYSLVSITLLYFISRWAYIGLREFLLILSGFILHNLGAWGFYLLSWNLLAFDNLVHFYNAAIAAWVMFNFISKKFKLKVESKDPKKKKRELNFLIIMITLSFVIMLGTAIEIVEFFGYMFFGEGEGLFLTGPGDGEGAYQYVDTMTDTLVNVLGAITGTLLYYNIIYKKNKHIATSMCF